jgi:redox-sensing transcriptional repressor
VSDIPDIVIGRLPIYLRELKRLAQDEHKLTTSSHELGKRLGISSAQIRKDLSHFGEFGKQGTGYHINFLVEKLEEILHLTHEWPVALIGAGYLGHALANYAGFQPRGFRIKWVFDSDPTKIGGKIGDLTIQSIEDLKEIIFRENVKMAIVAIPIAVVQDITDTLVESGVKAILSYVPVHLDAPEDVQISYSDPVTQMQRMTFYLE